MAAKIIRTPTNATGGITKAEHRAMESHAALWTARAFRTEPINHQKITDAIVALYAAANLEKPKVIVVPSPLVMAFAYGAAAARIATCEAARISTCEATRIATYGATYGAIQEATRKAADSTIRSATYNATNEVVSREIYAATRAAVRGATHVATVPAIRTAVLEATYAATDEATYTATDVVTRIATDEATYAATDVATRIATAEVTHTATRVAAQNATYLSTRDAVYLSTRVDPSVAAYAATRNGVQGADNATAAATDYATRIATRIATHGITYTATHEATRSATDVATYIATDGATRQATYDATRVAARSITNDVTRDAVRDTVDAIRGAMHGVTYNATRSAAFEAFRAQTGIKDISTFGAILACNELGGDDALATAAKWPDVYQGGNMWAPYECYLTAMRDIIGLQLPEHEKYKAWETAAIEGGFRVMHGKFCLVSDFPEIIKMDDNNRPHCADGPSHRWRDGWSLYHWHGVAVPSHWIEFRDELDASEVLKEENLEKRRAGCEIIGWPKMLKQLGSKMIDRDSDPEIGELLEVKLPDLPRPSRFLRVRCGTGREFMIGVPPEMQTALDAQAWMVGLSTKDFRVPEVRT